MTLFNLSVKNIKKSIKDYAVYFFTLILGVALFYVFNAISSQAVMLDINRHVNAVVELMGMLMNVTSVFVAAVLGFLIIYAGNFMMKRRNKEFGLYLVLGMGKKKISAILFGETMIIGVVSLAAGLLVGVMGSQLMSIFVANMFRANMTQFQFIFAPDARIKTVIYFTVIYILVMIFNTVTVSRCKLIDLMQKQRMPENIKRRSPFLCRIVFAATVPVLGYAYWLVTAGSYKLDRVEKLLIPISLGCVCTFLIFWSVSGFILFVMKKAKGIYYKDLNSFTARQFADKANTNVMSMTVICLMVFVTICTFSSALSMNIYLNRETERLSPADVEIIQRVNMNSDWLEKGYSPRKIANSNLTASQSLEHFGFDADRVFSQKAEIVIYNQPQVNLEYVLGGALEQVKAQYPHINLANVQDIVTISRYNSIRQVYGQRPLELGEGQYMIVANYDNMVGLLNLALSYNRPLEIMGHSLMPATAECVDGFMEIGSSRTNGGFLVVPDSAIDPQWRAYSMLVGIYKDTSRDYRSDTDILLQDIVRKMENTDYVCPYVLTKVELEAFSIGLSAMVTFVGMYVGIIFLVCSAAVLALKELSESSDNVNRFAILRKIGAGEDMINKALFRQIGIFFVFPLMLALIHSIFGLKFCDIILGGIGQKSMFGSLSGTLLLVLFIYGTYFLITYFCSKNIIREQR